MKAIIGLDTHIATCDYFAVTEAGQRLGSGTVETKVPHLRRMLEQIKADTKVIVIESGCLAPWLHRTLTQKNIEVVVTETSRNRWISRDPVKNDAFDAEKLAQLYRGGFYKQVVLRNDRNAAILQAVTQRHDLVQQLVRVKNKIKAKYRQNGIRVTGQSVFASQKQKYLEQLTEQYLKDSVYQYYEQLNLLENQIEVIENKLSELRKFYPIIKILCDKFPGIGLISAAIFVAYIESPERFSTKKKLWAYCAVGIDFRSSGGAKPIPRLTIRGNRQLKSMLLNAVHTAIHVGKPNPMREKYKAMIEGGKPIHKTKFILARNLAKEMWNTWKAHNKSLTASAA